MPSSEVTARITASLAWVFAALATAYWYSTRKDEGLESIGSALGLVMLVAPVFLLGFATLVALVLRWRLPDAPRIGAVTWVLCLPPALVGVWFALLQLRRLL